MSTVKGNDDESPATSVKTDSRGKGQHHKPATDAEDNIWDDTELLADWDAAHAEYMKYHSIAAQEKAKREAAAKDAAIQESDADMSAPTDDIAVENVNHDEIQSTSQAEHTVRTEQFQPPDIKHAEMLAETSPWWAGYCAGFKAGAQQAGQDASTTKTSTG